MKISNEAEAKIKSVIQNNPNKLPKIILKKGGCAGTMLALTLCVPSESDEIVESNGIKFVVSEDAMKFIDDISIEVKIGLGKELIIRNNKAQTCKCGKSFRA